MDHASWATTPAVRQSMIGNTSRDTGPEMTVRRRLHAMGLRYRVSIRPVPSIRRTGDVVFTKHRLVVFIDGCFWHGCPDHYTAPKSNFEFWKAKVERNRERDAETDAILTANGWQVLRFWTHEDPDDIVATVASQLPR